MTFFEKLYLQKTSKFRNFKVYNSHIITMLRNSKVHYKSSELYPILSMHFGESMNLARIKAMSLVICERPEIQWV